MCSPSGKLRVLLGYTDAGRTGMLRGDGEPRKAGSEGLALGEADEACAVGVGGEDELEVGEVPVLRIGEVEVVAAEVFPGQALVRTRNSNSAD